MRSKTILALAVIVGIYLATHLVNLTDLPVFADEAIYIRWAQLIIDDAQRYLFFPMNDGKTPLFIWLLVPLQSLFDDQLFAARFVSVLIGFIQVGVMAGILRELKVRWSIVILGMLFIAILPFWYIHHRLALMDGLLTLGISLSYWGALRALKYKFINWKSLLMIGGGLGIALWSKLPAVLAMPLLFMPVLLKAFSRENQLRYLLSVVFGITIGVGLFLLLWFNPSFGQLFSRGSDFLYPISEVLFNGLWRDTLRNFPTYAAYFVQYLTPSFILLMLAGLFAPHKKSRTHLFFWSGVLFCVPISLLGKVVFPRYLFPASLFFTLAGISAIEGIFISFQNDFEHINSKNKTKHLLIAVVLGLLTANVVISSTQFIGYHLLDSNNTQFVSADKQQYLTSWSSGHGIVQIVSLINKESNNKKIAIATEGYFGTLPDGLLLYFHDRDVNNLYMEGVGQPVNSIPDSFKERARDFDETWLVVNSHRLGMELPEEWLIAEYCRPDNSPCLQVWNISDLIVNN